MIKKPLPFAIVLLAVIAAILYLEQPVGVPEQVISDADMPDEKEPVNVIQNKTEDTNVVEEQVWQRDTSKANNFTEAPDFKGIVAWINSEALSLEELRGKVVLIDFWTYSCINCIRTLPYVTAWDDKYRDKGLVIVGVHAPEFIFEKRYENVLDAVKKHGIEYPVAMDNDKQTWKAYQNRYWPRKYLIDVDGYIRYDKIGEGDYDKTEEWIQRLLKERMERIDETEELEEDLIDPDAVDVDFSQVGTSELYFGDRFSRRKIGNDEAQEGESGGYTAPDRITRNVPFLEGTWKRDREYMELESSSGSIFLNYSSKVVNIVAESENRSEISVYLDDEEIGEEYEGDDIGAVSDSTLYNIVSGPDYENHLVEIRIKGEGFRIFTFTFG